MVRYYYSTNLLKQSGFESLNNSYKFIKIPGKVSDLKYKSVVRRLGLEKRLCFVKKLNFMAILTNASRHSLSLVQPSAFVSLWQFDMPSKITKSLMIICFYTELPLY